MAAIGRNMLLFLLLNTIIYPYYHNCGFITDIYLTISLSTHNGDDTPQNYALLRTVSQPRMNDLKLVFRF